MKKINLMIVFLIVIALAACDYGYAGSTTNADEGAYSAGSNDNNNAYEPRDVQADEYIELELRAEFASDELLSTFDYIHEVDYSLVRRARSGGHDIESFNGDRIVIWANVPLHDFALIWMANDMLGDDTIYIPADEAFGLVEELSLGHAFVINHYVGLGTMPWSGVRFVDGSGQTRYFAMIQNQGYPDAGGDRWHIWEFENRADELPDDWEPWWLNDSLASDENTFTTPSPELRARLLSESGISEHGWQAAVDFLKDFDSLFVGVFHEEVVWDEVRREAVPTGSFWRWGGMGQEVVRINEQPEITFAQSDGEHPGFFDINGARINEAPWAYIQRFEESWRGELTISYSHHYANYFKLFDFNGNGIPDILMHFQQTFEGCYGGFYRIFRYIDGEYRMLEMAAYTNREQQPWINFGSSHELFVDANDRIITFIDSELTDMKYEHLRFVGDRAELHRIVNIDYNNMEEWREHHWQTWRHTSNGYEMVDSWMFYKPTIFGTDIAIRPLQAFEDLGAELLGYLRYTR